MQDRNGPVRGLARSGGEDRPLTARSVLASTLLGADPPELPVSHLVHVAGLFGINENRGRVALSRMVASGEVTSDGSGHYRLAGHLLERQHRQSVSRLGRTGSWSGDWHLVVMPSAARSAEQRARQRRDMVLARLAELRQGTWARPDNLEVAIAATEGEGMVRFVARPAGDGVSLAHSLWDLAGWAERARRLVDALGAHDLRAATDLAPGFVLSASVLRHFQADPLLPAELLPSQWPGDELRSRYDDWDAKYRRLLVAYAGEQRA